MSKGARVVAGGGRPEDQDRGWFVQPTIFADVENSHTIPTVEMLEKMARALDMYLYQFLYEGPEPPALPKLGIAPNRDGWGSSGKDARVLQKLRGYLSKVTPRDRRVLMAVVSQLVKQNTPRNLK